jgi:hypothetical protein
MESIHGHNARWKHMRTVRVRSHRKVMPVKRPDYVAAINELVAVAGLKWFVAKNIIRWRIAQGLSIFADRIQEPNGAVTWVRR